MILQYRSSLHPKPLPNLPDLINHTKRILLWNYSLEFTVTCPVQRKILAMFASSLLYSFMADILKVCTFNALKPPSTFADHGNTDERRSMISEFKTETELRISDNGESLTLLLDVIYSRYPIDGSSRQSQRRMLNASSNLHASMMSDRQRMHVINI